METSDVLRRVRYTIDARDADTVRLCALGGVEVTPSEVAGWLARERDPAFVSCPEPVLAAFLDGLVIDRRGPRDPSAPPRATDVRLDNNLILKKLRIAFELQEQDMLAVLELGGISLSAPELGGLFRKPDHKHFRPCGDQILRKFLTGLTERLRGKAAREGAPDPE